MSDLAEEMALLFKQSATDLAAAAKKRAAMNDPTPAEPVAGPPRAGGRLRGGVAGAQRSGPRPGGAATSAAAEVSGQAGWAAPPGKFGYQKIAIGPEPTVTFTAPKSPGPLATDEASTDQASAAAKKHMTERAFQDMMDDFACQNAAESGEIVDGRFQ
jgi:hypothetical protein